MIKNAKLRYERVVAKESKSTTKIFYKYINHKIKKKVQIDPIRGNGVP